MSAPDPIARARALAPLLREHAAEGEALRQLAEPVHRALAAGGFYRLWVPEELGGSETPPRTALEAIEELAVGDGSAAWVAFIAITSSTALAGLPEATRKEVFTTPETMLCGVFAPRGRAEPCEDGVRVNGRWPFGSGSAHADWVLAGCLFPPAPGGDAPRQHMVLVPASQIVRLDNWDVAGLSGTGSSDYTIEDVVVPEARIVGWQRRDAIDRPLYRFPLFPLLALSIASVALGLARASLEDLVTLASEKKPMGSQRVLAERPAVQVEVARVEASVRAARAFLYETVDAAWARATAGEPIDERSRADLRLATVHAARAGARATERLFQLAGASSIYRETALQRRWRDAQVAAQHAMVSDSLLELTGRVRLGLPVDVRQL